MRALSSLEVLNIPAGGHRLSGPLAGMSPQRKSIYHIEKKQLLE